MFLRSQILANMFQNMCLFFLREGVRRAFWTSFERFFEGRRIEMRIALLCVVCGSVYRVICACVTVGCTLQTLPFGNLSAVGSVDVYSGVYMDVTFIGREFYFIISAPSDL